MKTRSIFCTLILFAFVATTTLNAQFGVRQDETTSDNYFMGDVGIGKTSPSTKLDVLESSVSMGTNSTAIRGINTGEGNGALFTSGKNQTGFNSFPAAIFTMSGGNNNGIFTTNSGSGQGIIGQTSGTGDAIEGWAFGSGRAGWFHAGDVQMDEELHVLGRIGTGTTNPLVQLHVKTTGSEMARFESSAFSKWISFYDGSDRKGLLWNVNEDMVLRADDAGGKVRLQTLGADRMTVLDNGNIGIGTTAPDRKLQVVGGTDVTLAGGGYIQNGNTGVLNMVMDNNEILVRTNGVGSTMYVQNDGGDLLLCGQENGQVGIGVTSSGNMPSNDYLLAVDGKIASEELLVELSSGWPDYVFEKTYQLQSLEEVEKSIQENGHLPGIPSAEEVEKLGGIHVGDMQTRTIEKVEELTLYAIDANKKIKELENKLEVLIKRIEELEEE